MISLCMICHNEQSGILDCLESSKGAWDELCLVRAIGYTLPDDTVKLARAWALDHGKTFQFADYRNADASPRSAFVDHFAEARNSCFNISHGDWLLWMDCDDRLDPLNCERIREAVATCPESVAALSCTYRLGDSGGEVLRERLFRAGSGTWEGAIHETFTVTGAIWACPQIVFQHTEGDAAKKKRSASRNIALLENELKQGRGTGRIHGYLCQDYKIIGDNHKSWCHAVAAWDALPDDLAEERYSVALLLSELQPDQMEHHLFAAIRTQPHRREAFALLCQRAIFDGRRSDAVSFFRLMDSLPEPKPLPWTHAAMFHGWARHYLKYRILKLCGQDLDAEQFRRQHAEDIERAEAMK